MSALRRLSWLILPVTGKLRTIETLPVVSSVRFHVGDKTHKAGYHVNLRCGCGVKQVGTIRISSKFPTLRDCLRDLGQRIERDHGPACVNDVLMLHRRLKMIQKRATEANKADCLSALEAEKERDEFHNQIEQIKNSYIRREHALMVKCHVRVSKQSCKQANRLIL